MVLDCITGSGPSCPDSVSKPNKTQCDDHRVCYIGECSASICLAHGMVACQCAPTKAGDWTDEILCQVCCEDHTDNDVCKSSFELASVPDLKSLAGSPCMDYTGYCDVFFKCREVDPSGPLNNIRKLIIDGDVITTLTDYLREHWYVGLAAALGLVILTVIFVRVCSYSHVPPKEKHTENPRPHRPGNIRNRVAPNSSSWI
ncbi:hypothetical protein ScPMuIL_000163 [Solemya velum]